MRARRGACGHGPNSPIVVAVGPHGLSIFPLRRAFGLPAYLKFLLPPVRPGALFGAGLVAADVNTANDRHCSYGLSSSAD